MGKKVSHMLNESVKQALFIEYWCNNNRLFEFRKRTKEMLYEEHGIKSDIDLYWDVFEKYIDKHSAGGVIQITRNIFSVIPGCFFKKVDITIWLSMPTHSGNTLPTKMVNGELDKFECVFNVCSCRYNDVIKEIKPLFYHEFMHLYEEYQRQQHGVDGIFDIANKTRYNDIVMLHRKSMEGVRKKIYYLLYFLFDFETNAFAGTVAGEIRNIDVIPNNHREANDLIKKTSIYQTFEGLGQFINNLCELTDYDIQKDADNNNKLTKTKDIVVDAWVKATNKENDFDTILSQIKKMYGVKFKKFKTVAAKLLCDKTMSVPHVILDDGIDMDFSKVADFLRTDIKPKRKIVKRKQK